MTEQCEEKRLPKVRDMQLALASLWLEVASIAKRQLEQCSHSHETYARFWESICERSSARALDYMRAGLHKKKEST